MPLVRQVAQLVPVAALLAGVSMLLGADFEGEREIRAAAQSLVPAFTAEPTQLREAFAPALLKELDGRSLRIEDVFRSLHEKHGKAQEYRLIRMVGPYTAEIEFVFGKGLRKPTRLALDHRAPHAITGLEFRAEVKGDDSYGAIIEDLRKLPGRVGFKLCELAPQPRTLAELNSEEPLAVASSMKLVILAAVAEEVAQGKRSWPDVVKVRGDWASLPAGVVQDWPDGSPVTLHSLATLMASRSDNTAADHLLRILGRDRIERMQADLNLRGASRNRPFLTTSEMFKLKLVLPAADQRAYAEADEAGRRRLLETQVAEASLARHRGLGAPQAIDSIEWFYSPDDLIKVLDFLRSRQCAPEARQMLAITRGLAIDEGNWKYIGFKGGAEPGVLNFSVLLQDRKDRWLALAMGWNNPEDDVDRTLLSVLAQRLLWLARTE
jgi:hypothetical protein